MQVRAGGRTGSPVGRFDSAPYPRGARDLKTRRSKNVCMRDPTVKECVHARPGGQEMCAYATVWSMNACVRDPGVSEGVCA